MKTNNILPKLVIAFVMGFSLEFLLSKLWGYNQDIITFLGVPLFIVFVWTIALPVSYELRKKLFKKRDILKELVFILIGIFSIEFVGGVIMGLRLSVASDYPAVLPFTVFQAPFWLLIVYFMMIFIYWNLLDLLGGFE